MDHFPYQNSSILRIFLKDSKKNICILDPQKCLFNCVTVKNYFLFVWGTGGLSVWHATVKLRHFLNFWHAEPKRLTIGALEELKALPYNSLPSKIPRKFLSLFICNCYQIGMTQCPWTKLNFVIRNKIPVKLGRIWLSLDEPNINYNILSFVLTFLI